MPLVMAKIRSYVSLSHIACSCQAAIEKHVTELRLLFPDKCLSLSSPTQKPFVGHTVELVPIWKTKSVSTPSILSTFTRSCRRYCLKDNVAFVVSFVIVDVSLIDHCSHERFFFIIRFMVCFPWRRLHKNCKNVWNNMAVPSWLTELYI